jgi:hypothetical protein
MDYKKIIRSRKARLMILKCLSFIPDKPMLHLQYRIKMGRKLDLKNPQRYSEKLQWYTLYHKDALMIQCVDKYDVRSYVESLGLGHILNECYGVFDRVEDIDFDTLPEQFVLKDTLGGGGNSVILVRNKREMDLDAVKVQLRKWVNENHRIRGGGREWPYYSGKKHRILIERYIPSDEAAGGLIDYKLFCFDGKVEYAYGIAERTIGCDAALGIFDKEFNQLPYKRTDERPLERKLGKPQNYEIMVETAQTLAKEFPHARIDFYNQDNTVILGEITFFDGSGYVAFEPDEFDYILGEKFVLRKS